MISRKKKVIDSRVEKVLELSELGKASETRSNKTKPNYLFIHYRRKKSEINLKTISHNIKM